MMGLGLYFYLNGCQVFHTHTHTQQCFPFSRQHIYRIFDKHRKKKTFSKMDRRWCVCGNSKNVFAISIPCVRLTGGCVCVCVWAEKCEESVLTIAADPFCSGRCPGIPFEAKLNRIFLRYSKGYTAHIHSNRFEYTNAMRTLWVFGGVSHFYFPVRLSRLMAFSFHFEFPAIAGMLVLPMDYKTGPTYADPIQPAPHLDGFRTQCHAS